MEQAPDEQRRLNLPATQPVALGDTSSSSTTSSTRFYLPQAPAHQSHSKGITKRPSTATLGQTSDVLLPATRHALSVGSDETVTAAASLERRSGEHNIEKMHGASITSGRLASDESFGESIPHYPFTRLFMFSSDDSKAVSRSSSTSVIPPESVPITQSSRPTFLRNLHEDDYDWVSFIQAYAAGKWDPRLTPNPPRTTQPSPGTVWDEHDRAEEHTRFPPFIRTATTASAGTVVPRKRVSGTSSSSSLASKLSLGAPSGGSDRSTGSGSTSSTSISSAHSTSAPASSASPLPPHAWQEINSSLKMRRQKAQHPMDMSASTPLPETPLPQLTLPPPSRSFISRSMSDTSATFSPVMVDEPRPNGTQAYDLNAAAAAMRLAGDGIDVRPLALPSPEVELTDPFRGHTASIIPWREQEKEDPVRASSSSPPEQTRKTRLNSFWNGLDEVGSESKVNPPRPESFRSESKSSHPSAPSGLPTISASPLITPDEVGVGDSVSQHSPPNSGRMFSAFPAASAPAVQDSSSKQTIGDYFGMPPPRRIGAIPLAEPVAQRQALLDAPSSGSSIQYFPVFETSPASSRDATRPPLDRTASEPVNFYRNTSPDPSSLDPVAENDSTITRPHSDSFRPTSRKVREEVEYSQRGYLIPPMPPNEWERQKALYKYVANISWEITVRFMEC